MTCISADQDAIGLSLILAGGRMLETYAILYVPEEVGHEDHDVFRVAREVRRDA